MFSLMMSSSVLEIRVREMKITSHLVGIPGNSLLGLAISKAIIDAHGGTIEVQSQVDAGTIFTVRIPTIKRDGR